jgi:peroxiredoxin family protein
MKEIFGTKQREDVLEIVDKGGNIAEYFSKTDPICKDIGSRIILAKELGKGGYGAVYKVDMKDFDSVWSKRLVVKKMEVYTVKTIVEKEEREIVSKFYKRACSSRISIWNV